jgi:hypothetical protein
MYTRADRVLLDPERDFVHLHDHQPTKLEQHMQQAKYSSDTLDRPCLEHSRRTQIDRDEGHMTPYLELHPPDSMGDRVLITIIPD